MKAPQYPRFRTRRSPRLVLAALLALVSTATAEWLPMDLSWPYKYDCPSGWVYFPGSTATYYCWMQNVDPLDINPQCPSSGTTGNNGASANFWRGSAGPTTRAEEAAIATDAASAGAAAERAAAQGMADGGGAGTGAGFAASGSCRSCGGTSSGGNGGGGFVCCPDDGGASEASPAMPSWSVVEPHLQLLVKDKPFFYNTGSGRQVAFELHYKGNQGANGRADTANPVIFSVGTNWHSPWRSYMQPIYTTWNGMAMTNVATNFISGTTVFSNVFFIYLGDGSARQYSVDTNSNDKASSARLLQVTNGANIEYWLSFPNGSRNVYGQWVRSGGFDYCLLTKKVDSLGNTAVFTYDVSTVGIHPSVRLDRVTDSDGLETTFTYTSHPYYSHLLTGINGPYGLTNRFGYDPQAHLTNLTDVAGIRSQVNYGTDQRVTQLLTPYGTTTFKYYGSTWKALRVDEHGSRKSLYLAGYDRANVLPTAADESASLRLYLAMSSGNNPFGVMQETLDASGFDTQNTFYWGPRNYQNLPSAVRDALDNDTFSPTTLQSQNYFQLGWTRHWLRYYDSPANAPVLSDHLSLERAPSPSTDGSTEGLLTWYDYKGKTGNGVFGTETARQIQNKAWREPGGEWRVINSVYNRFGRPTVITDNYSKLETVQLIASWTPGWRRHIYTYRGSDGNEWFSHFDGADVTGHSFEWIVGNSIYSRNVATYSYSDSSNPHAVTGESDGLAQWVNHAYDSSTHRLIRTTRPSGLIVEYAYDGSGFLSSVVSRSATEFFSTNTYTYTNGYVLTHTDPRGLTVTNVWDPLGRLVRVMFPDGTGVTNVYDRLDLVRTYDRMGFTNDYGYNSFRELVAHTNANRRVTTYQYCDCGGLESVTDAAGNTTSFTYDNLSQRIRQTLPGNSWTENAYNLLGQVVGVTDSAGGSLTNHYTIDGAVWLATSAEGVLRRVLADVEGQTTNAVDAAGLTNLLDYDALGRLVRRYQLAISRYEPVEQFVYNSRGLLYHYDADLRATTFELDELGRKKSEVNRNDEVTQFAYGPAGDLLTLTDAKSQVTTWNYDEFGRVTNKLAAGNALFRYTYDANGRLKTRWTPGSGGSGILTQYSYDAAGNLTFVNYPTASDLTLQYDAVNRLTNMLDAAGQTRYTYTVFGALASEDGPWDGDTVNYSHDNGRRRSGLNLLQPNAGAWAVQFNSDTLGRLTNVVSPAGAFGYRFHQGGIERLSSEWIAWSLLPTIGSAVESTTLPGIGTITSEFDAANRLLSTRLRNTDGAVLNAHDYQLNELGQRTRQSRTDGSYVDYGYDHGGQLVSAAGKEAGGTDRLHEQLGYDYDAAGNLNWRTNNDSVQQFNVNSLNQLTAVGRNNTLTVAGTVQGSPGWLTINDQGVYAVYGDQTFVQPGVLLNDGSNTITAVTGDWWGRTDTNTVKVNLPATVAFVYDLNGNLRTNGTRLLDYDDENQLISVTEPGAWRSDFVYDGKMRRRVRKEFVWQGGMWVQSQEVRYVYDGNLVIQERNGMNLPQVTYTRGRDLSGSLEGAGGIGGLLARTENSQLNTENSPSAHAYYHADGNGNITCLINSHQEVVARYLYDPYGNTLAATGPLADDNLYRFSSKELHAASGLVYYLYRYYEPTVQLWLNRDPIDELGFALLTTGQQPIPTVDVDDYGPGIGPSNRPSKSTELNLYAFVENRPTTEVDPLGLFLGFGYGKHCGYSRWGDEDGIDDVDNACKKHDQCLKDWKQACKFKFCNVRFCKDVAKAKCHGDKACKKAKRKILAGCVLIVPIPPFIFM